MSEPIATVDAIRVPRHYHPGGPAEARHVAFRRLFGPILGIGPTGLVHAVAAGPYLLLRKDPSESLLFPKDHPYSGRDRYQWMDRGDGVEYGRLVPDDAPPERTAEDELAAFARWKASPEGKAFLEGEKANAG